MTKRALNRSYAFVLFFFIFQISQDEAQNASRELRIPYIECSAKLRMNVDQSFHELVRIVRKYQASERPLLKPSHNNPRRKCTIL